MPTPVDLVTDLPADFEVFGQAVDTSLADLKGGTTGQILSKATNTDMDFVWITNDQGDITAVNVTSPITGGGTSGAVTVGIQSASTSQSGAVQLSDSTSTTSSVLAATPTAVKSAYDLAAAAIPKSTVTAKGSIVAASGSSTPAQLAVGNNGETLVADSSTATGLRYQTSANGNGSVNGGMDIWQRGTSFTNTNSISVYAADRWTPYSARTGGTVSRQSASLDGFQYCLRFQRDSGNTGTGDFYLMQPLETSESIKYAGQTVTMSFYARAGANYSAASNGLIAQIRTGTGTDQNPWAGYTGSSTIVSQTKTLTTSWQRFTVTGAVGTTATELSLWFAFTPTGTAGANDYFEVTGVQLEIGSVPTTFKRAGGTIAGELAACQRYLPAVPAGSAGDIGTGFCYSITQALITIPFRVQPRVTPTGITISAASDFAARKSDGSTIAATSVTLNNATLNAGSISLGGLSGVIGGNGTSGYVNASGYVLFTGCEL